MFHLGSDRCNCGLKAKLVTNHDFTQRERLQSKKSCIQQLYTNTLVFAKLAQCKYSPFSVKGLFKVLYNICTPLTHTLTYSWSCGSNHQPFS